MKKTVRVEWKMSGTFCCPECQHDYDFTLIDEYWVFCKPLENKDSFFYPIEFVCEECGIQFNVNGADY